MTSDQELVKGSQLKLQCSLRNTTIDYNGNQFNVDSSMIFFKFNKQYYPSDKVMIVNDTTTELVVDDTQLQDSGTYYCMLNKSGLNHLDHHPIICLSHVKVGCKSICLMFYLILLINNIS